MFRATHCAIARKPSPALWGKKKCTGRPTAPVLARYRCFLPDLAGLAGLRRVGPGTKLILTPLEGPARGSAHRRGSAVSDCSSESSRSRMGGDPQSPIPLV